MCILDATVSEPHPESWAHREDIVLAHVGSPSQDLAYATVVLPKIGLSIGHALEQVALYGQLLVSILAHVASFQND
jgi:hypothetical protein